MAEDVSTGGLHRFRYEKGEAPKLSGEKKKEIHEAYEKYYERRARERRNKIIFWLIGILVLIALTGFVWKFL
jgi:UDP-N-acetylmuramyl pentapeptide phosphotransferase/UDP-N-acetylglucosamine-1-phosphate transferase